MADNGDEIEICQNVGPHELVEMVKSIAVVKYSAVQVPAAFNRLECNTNLNLPPSNWLMTSGNSCGLHQAVYQTPGFASFRMAHMFPDCVGNVDVVSDAENIKQLLKLPYTSKGVISMVVHKVGNTVLLDEFDIQRYLLLKEDEEWNWLRTFMLEQIFGFSGKDHNFCFKDKSREAIQTKNLLSKFLYYSLKQSHNSPDKPVRRHIPAQLPITGPVLPEPKVEENVPDPKTQHEFNRNILWTFEDLRMLIGTDMPIFGGHNRPCVSLRLREMGKPINVLTGIDYWLDNLMCNVPEVIMCYHLDGIVQKYEIIKTEDLPYLEDSQFSPKIVRNVAQNILAFLKSNATKAGHTYWLFKGRNDDVVKLYDLTTLCKDQSPSNTCGREEQETPFTVPVAMLLYTVARNMKNATTRVSAKMAGNIQALLDNCIKLLSKEKFPQIVTSSHYMLSDLHIPAGIDPRSPKFDFSDDSDTQSIYEDEDELGESGSDEDYSLSDDLNSKELSESLEECAAVALQNIGETLKEVNVEKPKSTARAAQTPAPLIASTEERCHTSLEHISAGLTCLQFFNANEEKFIKESESRAKDEEKQRIIHEEQNPVMAKPFKPIPLPYESLTAQKIETANEIAKEVEVVEAVVSSKPPPPKLEKERKSKNSKYKNKKNAEPKDVVEPQPSLPVFDNDLNLGQNKLEYHHATADFNSQMFGSWSAHLKLLLLEKACLTYATMAELHYAEHKFGSCLRAIYLSFRCQQIVKKYMSTVLSQQSCLLGRAGDCFFEMSKNWEVMSTYVEQFKDLSEIDLMISSELEKDLDDNTSDLIEPVCNVEHVMVASCKCYENGLKYLTDIAAEDDLKREIRRRLGNVQNELGVKYMYWSQDEYAKHTEQETCNDEVKTSLPKVITDKKDIFSEDVNPLFVQLSIKSYISLNSAIDAFVEVQDNINAAFVYCNMGRYMRLRAHILMPGENIGFVEKQKTFYIEAFNYYVKALDALVSRKSNPNLWDLVNWEYSTATFSLAKQLQDHCHQKGMTTPQLEKDVLDYLQKSLTLCDVEHQGTRQIPYTLRSGLVHKRLGSFHYCILQTTCSDTGIPVPKATLQICKHHYEKAANILENLKEANEFLKVQLERISLQEYLRDHSSHNALKLKHLQQCLEICLNTKSAFVHITRRKATATKEEETLQNMVHFESRLQHALKTMIKLLLSGKDPKKLVTLYKKMYMESLRAKDNNVSTIEGLSEYLTGLLEKFNQFKNEAD